MKEREVILKVISELKRTLEEIKETDSENFVNNGGYIICVVLLELIQSNVYNPEDYDLAFDIENRYHI